jgi:hypothetical protein
MANRQIETVGSLIKMDDVTTVQHNIVPNTTVLEITDPYPDYLGDFPSGSKPNMIFLLTAEEYTVEHIVRISNRVQKYFGTNLDACQATLKIFNDSYSGIRIRGLSSFEQIKLIQQDLISEGLKFMKNKVIEAPALIHLRKPYLLEEAEEGIYKDIIEPMSWYFAVPEKLEWNMLKMMTANIKNNIDNRNFDAAFGWIFVNKITDIVRIYSDNLSLPLIKDLQLRYKEEIRKYLKL